jgi:hypothetical protein
MAPHHIERPWAAAVYGADVGLDARWRKTLRARGIAV